MKCSGVGLSRGDILASPGRLSGGFGLLSRVFDCLSSERCLGDGDIRSLSAFDGGVTEERLWCEERELGWRMSIGSETVEAAAGTMSMTTGDGGLWFAGASSAGDGRVSSAFSESTADTDRCSSATTSVASSSSSSDLGLKQ